MPAPANPKIYHIVHVDRLSSIAAEGFLWSDAVIAGRRGTGTTIGMDQIKERRLHRLTLRSWPGLHVGECVPFYFCPRSVMLYLISRANHPNLAYRGGQGSILHLEADLRAAVEWAEREGLRWAFTLSNAGSFYFEDRATLDALDDLNWTAIDARWWQGDLEEGKQAEFLVENRLPWHLIGRIGVASPEMAERATAALRGCVHLPAIEVRADWYY